MMEQVGLEVLKADESPSQIGELPLHLQSQLVPLSSASSISLYTPSAPAQKTATQVLANTSCWFCGKVNAVLLFNPLKCLPETH